MTNNKKIFPELFTNPKESFRLHLTMHDNYRILFSGRFGIGKTTFLNHYFNGSKNFNVIHLFPVNYSILENEDIFRYVKYDILLSLFNNNDFPLKSEYYESNKSIGCFFLENFGRVIATIIRVIPKIGKDVSDFLGELETLTKDYEKYKKSISENENDEINAFLTQFYDAEGSLYESNIITKIIQDWLQDIKSNNKENILIIDDLDRIDPNHIFRLLNIFSAHFDNMTQVGYNNKFNFSKVIFVCDVENIKCIFQNQFGIKADFNGYLDKFYSKEIYKFDNRQNILSNLGEIIKSIKIKSESNINESDLAGIKSTMLILLKPLILIGSINLRSLFKFFNEHILLPSRIVTIRGKEWFVDRNYFLSSLCIVSQLIGDFEFLKDKILKLPNFFIGIDDLPKNFIGDLIMLKDFEVSPLSIGSNHISIIEFDFTLNNSGKLYQGKYEIEVSKTNYTFYKGFLDHLIVDGKKATLPSSKREKLDVLELVRDLLVEISE